MKEGIVTKKMNPFVRQAIEIIRENAYQKLSVKDKGFQVVLELAWEMYLRGFSVEK